MPDLENLFDSAVNRSNLLVPFNCNVGQLHLRTTRVLDTLNISPLLHAPGVHREDILAFEASHA